MNASLPWSYDTLPGLTQGFWKTVLLARPAHFDWKEGNAYNMNSLFGMEPKRIAAAATALLSEFLKGFLPRTLAKLWRSAFFWAKTMISLCFVYVHEKGSFELAKPGPPFF